MSTTLQPAVRGSSASLADLAAVARYHIVGIAVAATLVFGWLLTGRHLYGLAGVVALDWFLINLLNRVTDIGEDLQNGIRGTSWVAAHRRALTVFGFTLMLGSIGATIWLAPSLAPWRAIVQLIGLGYNYRIVPTPRGLSRFKEIYFLKNFGSAALFALTGFVYPLAVAERQMSWLAISGLMVFFLLFEQTYEILYDLRDLEGDRAHRVPTYPVVHGVLGARRIIDGLLLGSSAVLAALFLTGVVGLREALMLAAPPVQLAFYRPRYRRGLTSYDCIVATHLGTALLVVFLIGTWVWARAGLPSNVWLISR